MGVFPHWWRKVFLYFSRLGFRELYSHAGDIRIYTDGSASCRFGCCMSCYSSLECEAHIVCETFIEVGDVTKTSCRARRDPQFSVVGHCSILVSNTTQTVLHYSWTCAFHSHFVWKESNKSVYETLSKSEMLQTSLPREKRSTIFCCWSQRILRPKFHFWLRCSSWEAQHHLMCSRWINLCISLSLCMEEYLTRRRWSTSSCVVFRSCDLELWLMRQCTFSERNSHRVLLNTDRRPPLCEQTTKMGVLGRTISDPFSVTTSAFNTGDHSRIYRCGSLVRVIRDFLTLVIIMSVFVLALEKCISLARRDTEIISYYQRALFQQKSAICSNPIKHKLEAY